MPSHLDTPRLPIGLGVRDLRLIDAIAAHGTLTRAGTALHLTQSALSHQLADLERRITSPLFVRLGRRMVPTPAGERLREWARRILASVARAEDELSASLSHREGLIRLTSECYTAYHWLPEVLRKFQSAFPRVETRVLAAATRHPFRALLRGDVDVAVVHTDKRERRIRQVPLFRDELVAVVPVEHPWVRRPFVQPDDFGGEHLLLMSAPSDSTFYREVLLDHAVVPRQVSEVHLTEAVIELVRAGLGVGALARWAIGPAVAAGHVAAVRVTAVGIHRQWKAATLRRKTVPAHLQAFVGLLRCKTDGAPERDQRASTSISTAAPSGSAETAMVVRAG